MLLELAKEAGKFSFSFFLIWTIKMFSFWHAWSFVMSYVLSTLVSFLILTADGAKVAKSKCCLLW